MVAQMPRRLPLLRAGLLAAPKPAQCLLQGAGEGTCSTAALRSTNVALGLVCWWLLLQSYRLLHPGVTGRQALTMVSATACLPGLISCLPLHLQLPLAGQQLLCNDIMLSRLHGCSLDRAAPAAADSRRSAGHTSQSTLSCSI